MGNAVRKRQVDVPRRRVIDYQKPAPKKDEKQVSLARETAVLGFAVVGIFLSAALFSYYRNLSIAQAGAEFIPNIMGRIGYYTARALFLVIGWCSFVVPLWFFLVAHRIWSNAGKESNQNPVVDGGFSIIGSLLMAAACAAAASVLFGYDGGGAVGSKIGFHLVHYLDNAGALLVSAATFFVALGFTTGNGLFRTLRLFRYSLRVVLIFIKDLLFAASGIFEILQRGVPGIRLIFDILFKYPWRISKKLLISGGKRLFSGSKAEALNAPTGEPATGSGGFVLGDVIFVGSKTFSEQTLSPSKELIVITPEVIVEPYRNTEPLKISRRGAEHSEKEVEERRKARFLKGREQLKKSVEKRRDKKRRESKQPEVVTRSYELPPLDILVASDNTEHLGPNDDELIANCKRLERALSDFKIGGKVVEVHPGPVITLYQFEPAAGIKVQRIINLADDLALALKVGSVRVYAPVPGKGTVGIEVPNTAREIVRLRDILDCNEFSSADHQLTLALGKDTFGDPFVADLTKMPHLLIAGATGTGKSVCINSILLSLLYRSTPDDLRLIMIDPKMLELSIYEDIPHLKAPVVTNPRRARGVLWWATEEMERRYRLMKDRGVRSLAGYNKLVSGEDLIADPVDTEKLVELDDEAILAAQLGFEEGERDPLELPLKPLPKTPKPEEKLPRIVIVVDELADLMLTVGREIEELLTRLAQKARAAGIHLILATQRPSVDVITGLIKANFPARISFKVASRIDARTVLDTSGAEKLLGMGDMLFLMPGASRVRRLHSAFVSDKEVQDVVEFLRRQGKPEFDENIEQLIQRMEESENREGGGSGMEEDFDPVYDSAVNLILEKGFASTSMVQRAFRIGYNRAARIVEMMEREGVVGPADGAKPRQVLVPNRQN